MSLKQYANSLKPKQSLKEQIASIKDTLSEIKATQKQRFAAMESKKTVSAPATKSNAAKKVVEVPTVAKTKKVYMKMNIESKEADRQLIQAYQHIKNNLKK